MKCKAIQFLRLNLGLSVLNGTVLAAGLLSVFASNPTYAGEERYVGLSKVRVRYAFEANPDELKQVAEQAAIGNCSGSGLNNCAILFQDSTFLGCEINDQVDYYYCSATATARGFRK